jgi:ParB family transcriptional regulator, chromosome partitioning protein
MSPPVSLTLALRRIVQGKVPRDCFAPDEMANLDAGLRAVGRIVQPIVV